MAATKTDRLLALAREIAEREQELERLRGQFAAGLAAGRNAANRDAPKDERQATKPPLARTRPYLHHRILEVLDASTVPMTTSEIMEELGGDDPLDTVRTTLSKLAARGLIARIEIGLYSSLSVRPERGRRPEGGG